VSEKIKRLEDSLVQITDSRPSALSTFKTVDIDSGSPRRRATFYSKEHSERSFHIEESTFVQTACKTFFEWKRRIAKEDRILLRDEYIKKRISNTRKRLVYFSKHSYPLPSKYLNDDIKELLKYDFEYYIDKDSMPYNLGRRFIKYASQNKPKNTLAKTNRKVIVKSFVNFSRNENSATKTVSKEKQISNSSRENSASKFSSFRLINNDHYLPKSFKKMRTANRSEYFNGTFEKSRQELSNRAEKDNNQIKFTKEIVIKNRPISSKISEYFPSGEVKKTNGQKTESSDIGINEKFVYY
jgi:hypothetical protein